MPLLGSKRRKTDANTPNPDTTKANDVLERTLSNDASRAANGTRSGPLRTKASSPQLLPRGSTDGNQRRPGLNRNLSRSWYGTWNNKASAVAQVARESISVAGGLTKATSADSSSDRSDATMNKSLRRGSKSAVSAPEPTKINATSDHASKQDDGLDGEKDGRIDSPNMSQKVETKPQAPAQADKVKDGGPSVQSPQIKQVAGSQNWFGWWSRPDGYAASEAEKPLSDAREDTVPAQLSSSAPAVGGAKNDAGLKSGDSGLVEGAVMSNTTGPARGWFGLWSATQNHSESPKTLQTKPDENNGNDPPTKQAETAIAAPQASVPDSGQTDPATNVTTAADNKPKSTGWAFWSKEQPASLSDTEARSHKHLGEIAVADTPSQSHPEAAQFNESPEHSVNSKTAATPTADAASPTKKIEKTERQVTDTKGNKQTKQTLDAEQGFAASAKSASNASLPLPEVPKLNIMKKVDAVLTPATRALKAQQYKPNMVEPQFSKTYPKAHVPTYWESVGYYLGYPFGLASTSPFGNKHVSIAPQRPKIKNAIAIGVHGYFPAPLVSKIIGQPTGTSIRFATHAAAAIRTWVQTNQPDVPCEVEQVALEGEGFIADRVAILWKLLLNWLAQLRNADFILVAAHSQGVPVAIMLVAKLIQLGCLNPHARVAICAMAGVNLGPFADYRSRFFGGSALELFEFSRPESKVSREYAKAVEVVLRHGVRVTYIGSIDDQLVSLESSLYSNLTHPYIQRAVFVDGRLYAPDFITHLVAFALKLRNLGISDHGLIRELSLPLAGSIYGGEGHSRVYDDEAVYTLALQFGLETTDMDARTVLPAANAEETPSPLDRRRSSENRRSEGGIPSSTLLANSIRRGSMSASVLPGIGPLLADYETPATGASANPYFLPWAMRGILEEPAVKNDMQDEVRDLVRLFDEWKPTSKALRDVKFRLEAVKSRL